MPKQMTFERFEELAMAYGGAIGRWPSETQHAAQLLCASDPAARAVLDEAIALDIGLSALPEPEPSEALMNRILGDAADIGAAQAHEKLATVAEPRKPARRGWSGFGGMFAPALGLAASLALGFGIGVSDTLETAVEGSSDVLASLVQSDLSDVDLLFDDDEEMFL